PAYRRGLALALAEAGFVPEEPVDLREWARSVVGPLILLTVREDRDWDSVSPDAVDAEVPVVALLPSPTPAAYAAALDRGATGAAPWDAAPEQIVRVLHAAAEGLAVLPLDVARSLARQHCPDAPPEWMTTTAVEFLRSLADGTTVGALARRTGCSERAMYRRLHSLYGRMGVNNRSEAIRQASRWGLL
ncbi:MAG TPA: LuxR C-terminal-related transcriptional regulator, partial [Acidimicrobiales bacterium]|nr:LuxR C-terminal-related transcriptional regulator [Acidimicrobiales bacterium]